MNDSQKRIRPASVAAFLFMPQFNLSFRQLSFIVPVFIRTIAVMFEQSGLLPQNHPATKYGMEGVKKYGFFELMGESWYTLRANSASPYQWSLFASVVMMIVFIVLSFITTLLNVSGMLIGTASAQIFDGLSGPTDIASIPAGPGGMFDQAIPAAGAHHDYGIMILDKVLREGVAGTGGVLQNAFGSLMEIYNTGMLVLAGIMLFWSVLSVVVDTAKTGQIGGQRHNMVWAPIRIVFGLGLLIPLGASGFSSGQFMVMKMAEWGSNFGTRGWVKYVDTVVNGDKMFTKLDSANASTLVNQYVKMWVCRVAYNGYEYSAVTGPSTQQIVRQVNNTGAPDLGRQSFSFANDTYPNFCGTVTYATPNDPALVRAIASSDLLAQQLANYETIMRKAYAELFINAAGDSDSGIAVAVAKELACAFVSQHVYGNPSATPPIPDPLLPADVCGSGYSTMSACGGKSPIPGPGKYPDAKCIKTLVDNFYKSINDAQDTAATGLTVFIASDDFMLDVKNAGWAGMGMWYHKIAKLNTTVSKMRSNTVTISAPSIEVGTEANAAKVIEIFERYDAWWQKMAVTTAPTAPLPDAVTDSAKDFKPASSASSEVDIKSALKSGDKEGLSDTVTSAIMPNYNPFLFLKGAAAAGLYPLATLSTLGDLMVKTATIMYAGLIIIPAGVAIVGGIVGAAAGLTPFISTGPAIASAAAGIANAISSNPFWSMLSALAGALLVSGLLLSFWVPLLPSIRVAFGALAWMVAVFEAVAMVPIAALTHISTEGEGMGGQVRNVWILWLNVLLRPILMVIGYVGAMLVFNTFVVYFNQVFVGSITNLDMGYFKSLLSYVIYTILYVGVIYTAANSIFKMVDMIPHAVAKYMGGQPDTTFDDGGAGMVSGAGHTANSTLSPLTRGWGKPFPEKPAPPPPPRPGVTSA